MVNERDTPAIVRELTRLAGLSRFEALGDLGIDELVRVLRENAATVEHVQITITRWLDRHRWLPSCSELIDTLEETRAEVSQSGARPDFRCKLCQGSGFQRIWLLRTYVRSSTGYSSRWETQEIEQDLAERLVHQVDGQSQAVHTAVKACTCDYGQRLRAARMAGKE